MKATLPCISLYDFTSSDLNHTDLTTLPDCSHYKRDDITLTQCNLRSISLAGYTLAHTLLVFLIDPVYGIEFIYLEDNSCRSFSLIASSIVAMPITSV